MMASIITHTRLFLLLHLLDGTHGYFSFGPFGPFEPYLAATSNDYFGEQDYAGYPFCVYSGIEWPYRSCSVSLNLKEAIDLKLTNHKYFNFDDRLQDIVDQAEEVLDIVLLLMLTQLLNMCTTHKFLVSILILNQIYLVHRVSQPKCLAF